MAPLPYVAVVLALLAACDAARTGGYPRSDPSALGGLQDAQKAHGQFGADVRRGLLVEEGKGAGDEDSLVAVWLAARLAAGDADGASELLLSSNNSDALARGLRVPDGVDAKRSADRSMDGDVVAMRAIAMAMLASGDEERAEILAAAIVQSLKAGSGEGSVALHYDDERSLRESLVEELLDLNYMHQVVHDDPDYAFDGFTRRLQVSGKVPAHSLPCAYCYPKKDCANRSWCPSG